MNSPIHLDFCDAEIELKIVVTIFIKAQSNFQDERGIVLSFFNPRTKRYT